MLLRQATSEGTAGAIDRAAVDAAVGAREVDVLEHALLLLALRQRMRARGAVRSDGDDLTRLDFAHGRRADDVERAGLGGEHGRVSERAHGERTPAARVARGEE